MKTNYNIHGYNIIAPPIEEKKELRKNIREYSFNNFLADGKFNLKKNGKKRMLKSLDNNIDLLYFYPNGKNTDITKINFENNNNQQINSNGYDPDIILKQINENM